MDQGWIKIHRSILEWEWFDDANTFRVFFYCLIKANHKLKTWQGIKIPRGTFITSYSGIAEDLKLSFQQVRTALDKLILTQEITRKATNKYTMISVCNYEIYQLKESAEQQTEQQTNNNQITTTKNDKKVIIKEKLYSTTIQKIVDDFYILKSKKDSMVKIPTKAERNKAMDVIDKLNRLDGHSFIDIQTVITRSITDNFWKDKILSLAGLRNTSKNGAKKFVNAAKVLLKSTYIPEPTKKLIGYRYKCPACGDITVKREFRPEDQFDAYTCKVEGCPKVQMVNKEMVGSTLKFIKKIYKEES
jgi:hypothetical protein